MKSDSLPDRLAAAFPESQDRAERCAAAIRVALDEAAQAVCAEAVDGTVSDDDAVYNTALDDAVVAIRALR